jgi:hypothetical protein
VRTGHKDTRHVFVAPRNDDHAIKPMTASSSLDLVSDEVPRLEGVGHPAGSHTDAITDAYCTELVAYDASVGERSFSTLSQTQ